MLVNSGSAPNDDEEKQIEKEEREQLYNRTTIALQRKIREIDEMNDYMSKTKEMLLKKFIDFNSMWHYDSEQIKQKVYHLLFEWKEGRKDLIGDDKFDEHMKEKDTKDETGSQKDEEDPENDKNEKKKRQQLKLDQELFEFEERGGFAQVLKDIYNPSDQSSMELDSVYQLKQLCKAFYEKKENLSNNLV